MEGIVNTLQIIQNNWSNLVIIVAIIFTVYSKIKDFRKLTKKQQVETALVIIKKELLKMMSDAELDWLEFKKSGDLKKSQVINEIYTKFPILKEYLNQDELIETISNMIDETMDDMNRIINSNDTV